MGDIVVTYNDTLSGMELLAFVQNKVEDATADSDNKSNLVAMTSLLPSL